MPIIDLVNEPIVATGIMPLLNAATIQGPSNDFSDGCDSMNMVVQCGTWTGVTTAIVQCDESTDGTTWVMIAGMQTTFTTTPSKTAPTVLRGLRSLQYVRANFATLTATATPSASLACQLIQQRKYLPISKSGTDRYPSA